MNQGSQGTVHSVRRHTAAGVMTPAAEIRVVADHGIEGDIKAGRPNRHVLLADRITLESAGRAPGELQEQITLELDGLQRLAPATELCIGTVRLAITAACEPCGTLARHCGATDERAFIRQMQNRRGMLAIVRTGGVIRPGDPVEVIHAS